MRIKTLLALLLGLFLAGLRGGAGPAGAAARSRRSTRRTSWCSTCRTAGGSPSSFGPTSPPTMSSGSRRWPAGLLQRPHLPPGDRRLHGPGRRSEGRRHRRLRAARPRRPSSTACRTCAERVVDGARPTTRTAPTASSSSCSAPRLSLDGKYTVFGRVVGGMNFVDAIEKGEPPAEPTRIVQASIAADNKPPPAPGQAAPAAAPAPARATARPARRRRRSRPSRRRRRSGSPKPSPSRRPKKTQ